MNDWDEILALVEAMKRAVDGAPVEGTQWRVCWCLGHDGHAWRGAFALEEYQGPGDDPKFWRAPEFEVAGESAFAAVEAAVRRQIGAIAQVGADDLLDDEPEFQRACGVAAGAMAAALTEYLRRDDGANS